MLRFGPFGRLAFSERIFMAVWTCFRGKAEGDFFNFADKPTYLEQPFFFPRKQAVSLLKCGLFFSQGRGWYYFFLFS